MNKRTVLVVGMAVYAASSSAQTFRPLGSAAVVNVGPRTAGPRFASADVTGDGLPDLVLGAAARGHEQRREQRSVDAHRQLAS